LFVDFTAGVHDEVFKIFGYEEEDIARAIAENDSNFDMEINSLRNECENLLKSVVPIYVPNQTEDTKTEGEKLEIKPEEENK